MAKYIKYPVQSVIGGTLLLTLAFSLSDGSVAQRESAAKIGLRAGCDINSVTRTAPERDIALVWDACLVREAKK